MLGEAERCSSLGRDCGTLVLLVGLELPPSPPSSLLPPLLLPPEPQLLPSRSDDGVRNGPRLAVAAGGCVAAPACLADAADATGGAP